MSGKKQKAVPGWFDCSNCKKRFSRQFMAKHAGDEESPCRPVYPYQKDQKLFSLLSTVTSGSKKIGDLPFIKDKRLASSTIFMSEELIKECGFTTFGWISLTPVTAADKSCADEDVKSVNESRDQSSSFVAEGADVPPTSYAFRVWPIPESIGSNPGNLSVVLSVEGFRTNKLLSSTSSSSKLDIDDVPKGLASLQRLMSSVKPVAEVFPSLTEVTIVVENFEQIDKESFDIDRFVASFKRIFQGRPIALNNRFKIRHYAQFVHFYVGKVDGSRRDVEEDLSVELEKLSLHHSKKEEFFQVTHETTVSVITKENLNLTRSDDYFSSCETLKDVGGLEEVVKELSTTIKFILTTDLDVPKGILLYGHIGVGKTLLAKAISNEFKLFQIHYEEFSTIRVGLKSEQWVSRSNSLEKIFKEAMTRSPSVIIVDGLDVYAAKKNSDLGTAPITQFAANFTRMVSVPQFRGSKVLVLCTATDLDRVDPNLRSPKIFAKEIEIPVPSAPQRNDILRCILRKIKHSLNEENIKSIADNTHGFVAADLRSLCNQASLDAINKSLGRSESHDPVIRIENMEECIKLVKPSAVKSILIDIPNVKWEDIGGQDELKFKLKQAIEWPLKHPESFRRLGISPPKGILMYGPPGCSKTMIAKAIATESGLNFISVKGSELFSKWVGESEKAVQAIFRKARQVAPCVVFFDEIDSLGGERGTSSGSSNVHERVLAQILVEIDGIEALKDVTIVAATNRPDRIDQALLRPGRLDRIIYVPLPDDNTRKEILKIRLKKMPADEEVTIEELVKATAGYSGAELTAVCHEAALKALEEDIHTCKIKQNHFEDALNIIKPRITQQQIDFYEKYSISRKAV